MTLESQLQLCNVQPGQAFVIEVEKLLPDDHRLDVFELDREQHLAVSLQLLKHSVVTILQGSKYGFDLIKNLVLGCARVDPLCKVIEQALFVQLAVLFAAQVSVDGTHAMTVARSQTLFGRAAVQV